MRIFFALIVLIADMGCATTQLRPPLNFATVESLSYGDTKSSDVLRAFGKPDKVIPLDSQTAIWGYDEVYPQVGITERLNISINTRTDQAVGAIWIPRPNEAFTQKEEILKHFKEEVFTKEVVGWVAKDYFSRDEVYTDNTKGVSFYLNTTHKTIEHIAFSQPGPNRKLSTN